MTDVLSRPTLVLNRNWQAVNIKPVMSALVKVFAGQAAIVDPKTYALYEWNDWAKLDPEEDDFTIQCIGNVIRVPEVITLNDYSKLPQRSVTFSRRNLFLRDKCTCQYCGVRLRTTEVTIDHITPKSRGGLTTWENCVVACIKCNSKKADKSLKEAKMKLLNDPVKPTWNPSFHCKLRIPSWDRFISAMYWNVELEE